MKFKTIFILLIHRLQINLINNIYNNYKISKNSLIGINKKFLLMKNSK